MAFNDKARDAHEKLRGELKTLKDEVESCGRKIDGMGWSNNINPVVLLRAYEAADQEVDKWYKKNGEEYARLERFLRIETPESDTP